MYKELPTWKRKNKHISMWFSLLKKGPIVAWCKGLRIGTKNCPLEKGLGNTCPCGFHYQKKGPIVPWCEGLSKDCIKNCPLEKWLHIQGLYQGLDPKDCMNNLDDWKMTIIIFLKGPIVASNKGGPKAPDFTH